MLQQVQFQWWCNMAYLGNRNATGDNNSFKILDDLAFTTTFNGSDGNVVNLSLIHI